MRKLKKSIIPFLLVGTVAALASCEPEPTPEPGPGPEPTPENVTVTFFTNLFKDSDIQWMEQVVENYEAEHEGVTIDWQKSGDYSDIDSSLKQLINTPARLPSMAVVYPDYVYNYLNTNSEVVLNMDPYINDAQNGFGKENGNVQADTVEEDIVEAYLKDGQNYGIEGTYSLPFQKTTEVMYYDQDIFTEKGYEVPTTWSEMIELARQMRADFPEIFTDANKGNAGAGAVAPIGYDSVDNMILSFCEMMGIPYSSNIDSNGDGHINRDEAVLFNNDEFKELLYLLKGWYDEGLITVSNTLLFDEPDRHWIDEPFTGKYSDIIPHSSFMVINSTTGADYCKTDLFVPSVASTPIIDKNILSGNDVAEGNSKVMTQGGSIVFFDKGDEINDVAWDFYKYMTNTANAANFAASYGSSPIRKSSSNEKVIQDIIASKDISTVTTTGMEMPLNVDAESPEMTAWTEATNDEKKYMTANIYDIYSKYNENSQGFIAPVSPFSTGVRSAMGNAVVEVFKLTSTGDQLKADIADIVAQAEANAE